MRRVVCTFSYIAAVCGLLASASPLLHTLRRGCFFFLFYCFSPVSCKAGGRGLLWISHASCRKLPRGCHNSLLWRPPPSLNTTIYSLALLASFNLITLISKWAWTHCSSQHTHPLVTVKRQKRSNPSPPSALTQGLTGLTGGPEVFSLNTLAIYDLPQSTITLEQPPRPPKVGWAQSQRSPTLWGHLLPFCNNVQDAIYTKTAFLSWYVLCLHMVAMVPFLFFIPKYLFLEPCLCFQNKRLFSLLKCALN